MFVFVVLEEFVSVEGGFSVVMSEGGKEGLLVVLVIFGDVKCRAKTRSECIVGFKEVILAKI